MNNGVSSIQVGRLLPGGTEVGEGSNKPVRSIAVTHSGEIVVIAKRLPLREIAVEVICATLGRAVGLPIPEPLLLVDEADQWHYGSIDLGHPNLSQYVQVSDRWIIDELSKWPPLLHAACFDELIANPDRNDGNLLYDGAGFFLIDHGMCIPHGMSGHDRSDDYHSNQLLDIQIGSFSGELDAQRSVNGAREWVVKQAPGSIDVTVTTTADHLEQRSKDELISFLKSRVAILGDLLHDRIKPSNQGRLELHD